MDPAWDGLESHSVVRALTAARPRTLNGTILIKWNVLVPIIDKVSWPDPGTQTMM